MSKGHRQSTLKISEDSRPRQRSEASTVDTIWTCLLNGVAGYPLVNLQKAIEMAIEIVDFPIKNGGSFHCYVCSPEGSHLLLV